MVEGFVVWGVKGGVGTGHVQSDAFMLHDIDTRWSCGWRVKKGQKRRQGKGLLEVTARVYVEVELLSCIISLLYTKSKNVAV